MPGNPILLDDQREFNRRLIEALERLGLIYAIGGSVAAMVYSEPRLTIDIDFMLDVEPDELARLVNEVDSWRIYISPLEAILETDIPHRLPFNVIDGAAGTRADFFVAAPSGLDSSAMSRRRRLKSDRLTGAKAWFLAPEDVILYKLDYYRKTGETALKHPRDITLMLAVVGEQLDLNYLDQWAAEIGVLDLWRALWDEFHAL